VRVERLHFDLVRIAASARTAIMIKPAHIPVHSTRVLFISDVMRFDNHIVPADGAFHQPR